ncbi:D-2-hydroxyacid dehydrogenase [Halarcobacter anaerophilus]|uniref:D-2-hydroxyacid dehydrogenase n=1 Tax=Halarcobacter anaerophilus TaxID=877500 RepID=UPI0005CA1BC7|nr:D-2-hydroxyacid dehydrogenase [Halarcobacter anaerophilus]
MKIVFLDRETLGKDISLEKFKSLGDVTIYEITDENQCLQRVKDADVVITNKVVIDKEIMDNSKVKLICIAATGTNNVDLEYAKLKGIEVKNVAGYSTSSVAQHTISLVLHFVQKLDYYSNYVKNKKWQNSEIFTHLDVPFYELENKNWGIIGLGAIGEKVANIAKSFGCNVNYYSTSKKNYNTNFNSISLEELVKTSDIITIHAPLNETTYNLINKTYLNMIKDETILINVGRGGIINEKDLAEILENGKDLYCGLDVLEKEPIEESNPLNKVLNNNKLIITPHVAWASVEARKRLIDLVYKNIIDYKL